MKNNFIYLNFKTCLENNSHHFAAKPFIEKIEDNYFEVSFKDVNFIKVFFDKSGDVEIWAIENGDEKYPQIKEFANHLWRFDLDEKKLNQGYLCKSCTPHVYTKDRSSMWEEHVYGPLLEWANKYIRPEHYLCLYEVNPKGASWLKILTLEEVEKDKDLEYRIYCEPIIDSERVMPV